MKEQIIYYLKKAPGYLSGEEISRSLNISRAGIWKNVEELRRQGYEIVAVPHLGYKLLSSPDKLFPWEIRFELGTKNIGRNIIYRETVHSTMDEAFQLGLEGAVEGTVICAENQTKGRGRLGRSWVSPKGKGIYMSILLRPSLAPTDAAQLTLLSAVAVCEAVNASAGIDARIKWPNDLLIGNRKLAGVLTELNAEVDRVKFIVIGIGINVNISTSQLPDGATSLKSETRKNFSRVRIVQEILRSFEKWYDCLKTEGFAPVLKEWKELSVTLGSRVRIFDQNGFLEGKAIGLDDDGGLLIRSDMGNIIKKMSGDVVVSIGN